jgi:hypothetical protein
MTNVSRHDSDYQQVEECAAELLQKTPPERLVELQAGMPLVKLKTAPPPLTKPAIEIYDLEMNQDLLSCAPHPPAITRVD